MKFIARLSLLLVFIMLGGAWVVSIIKNSLSVMPSYLVYILFLAVLIVLLYYILRPIISLKSVMKSQVDLPKSIKNIDKFLLKEIDDNKRRTIVKCMHRSLKDELSSLAVSAIDHSGNEIDSAKALIQQRYADVNSCIVDSAKSVAFVTMLSQYSKLDTIVVLSTNLRQIHRISRLLGYRPTFYDMARLYINVGAACFIASYSDDLIEEFIVPKVDFPFIGSITEGVLNGGLSLRIGYLTKAYINSPTLFNPKVERKKSFNFAKDNILDIMNLLKKEEKKEKLAIAKIELEQVEIL